MKALHITFRYGSDVYGGAEYHMRKLTEELHKKGVEVDICKSKTKTIAPLIKSAVKWDQSLENEIINDINIFRFHVRNPNKYISFIFDKIIKSRFDKEERLAENNILNTIDSIYDVKEGLLLTGWNNLERYGTFSMRWTMKQAIALINENNVSNIEFSVLNNKKIDTEVIIKSDNYEKKINLPKCINWEKFNIDIPNISGKIYIYFKLKKTWRPLKDIRTLGIAVSEIRYKTDKCEKHINLDNDFKKFLIIKKLYIDYLVSNAINRPKIYGYLFDYMRGPNSPEMERWLEKNIVKYDIIMAQMFPFNTIKYSMIAKKYNKPLILMPLMHVEDDFYHWSHYYNFMMNADLILANSKFSKHYLFDKIGINSVFAGIGIDTNIFLKKNIDGNKFIKKYNLQNKKIVLTVSRKSPIKRYDLLIKAIEKVKETFKNVILVMIGPEEDKVAINSEYVSYLGKVSEEDLVDAYDACNVFAMMSESESFGMVFCEAWARKKPVIGNINCGAVSTLIENGIDGFLCSNVEEIARHIQNLLEDMKFAEKLGENGFNKVILNYTWNIVANKVYKCYDELIEARMKSNMHF